MCDLCWTSHLTLSRPFPPFKIGEDLCRPSTSLLSPKPQHSTANALPLSASQDGTRTSFPPSLPFGVSQDRHQMASEVGKHQGSPGNTFVLCPLSSPKSLCTLPKKKKKLSTLTRVAVPKTVTPLLPNLQCVLRILGVEGTTGAQQRWLWKCAAFDFTPCTSSLAKDTPPLQSEHAVTD